MVLDRPDMRVAQRIDLVDQPQAIVPIGLGRGDVRSDIGKKLNAEFH